MHDPMTVAFDLKHVVIWHVDPETDGSDDSCGYSSPRIGKPTLEKLKKEAEFEYQFVFGREYATLNLNTASCYEVIHAVWSIIRWRFYKQRVTPNELLEITDLASNPNDNLRSVVYAAKHDTEEWLRLWICIFRAQARLHRKWYQHPKWHIRHWRIQIPILQKVRRFLFDRCARCGERFKYGYSPTRFNWESDKPKFMQSMAGVYHGKCATAERQKWNKAATTALN